jgi:hypothetical protein
MEFGTQSEKREAVEKKKTFGKWQWGKQGEEAGSGKIDSEELPSEDEE